MASVFFSKGSWNTMEHEAIFDFQDSTICCVMLIFDWIITEWISLGKKYRVSSLNFFWK